MNPEMQSTMQAARESGQMPGGDFGGGGFPGGGGMPGAEDHPAPDKRDLAHKNARQQDRGWVDYGSEF